MFKTVPSLSLLYFLDLSFKSYNVCAVKPRIIVSRDVTWDSCDIFCPLNVGFCELVSQKQEIQYWEGKSQTFCRNMVSVPGVPPT